MSFRIRLLLLSALTISAVLISPAAHAVTSADYYKAGLQLYGAKNYAMAAKYFGAAITLDPNNLAAYQGRANCEYALGDKPSALADYQKVESVQPNPQLQQFISMLQAQVAAPPPMPNVSAAAPRQKRDITFTAQYDVRFYFGASTMSLDDFKNNASTYVALGQYAQDQGFSPTYTGNVPDGFAAQLGVEVSKRFNPDFEGGLFFTFLPVGTASDNIAVPITGNPSVSMQDSYGISAELFGLQGRYTFMHGDFRPFVTAGLMAVPMQIAYSVNDIFIDPSLNYEKDTISGNFAAMGFGGQIQAGLDWDLGDGFVISPSLGFQFASANDFQATISNSSSSAQGSNVTLDVVQTDFGPAIEPVANGAVMREVYSKSQFNPPFANVGTAANNPTPMTVDLSGAQAILQASYNF